LFRSRLTTEPTAFAAPSFLRRIFPPPPRYQRTERQPIRLRRTFGAVPGKNIPARHEI
jgi:hypothetical protein